MTVLTEVLPHASGFLIHECNGDISREVVTLDTGNLTAGTVLGKITTGAATAALVAGGTGNGTFSAVTVGADAGPGIYSLVATSATKFRLEDPAGVLVGVVTLGTEFSAGGLDFTFTAGGTPHVVGDRATITVAAGSGKYVQFDQDGTDGRQHAAAILYREADATAGDVDVTVIARLATVTAAELIWPSDIEAGEKIAALAELAALSIIAR